MRLLTAFGRTPPGQFLRWLQWHARSAVWRRDRRYRPNLERLRTHHDRHHDDRCFIIGNGPSLKAMDLEPLRGEVTFGPQPDLLAVPQARLRNHLPGGGQSAGHRTVCPGARRALDATVLVVERPRRGAVRRRHAYLAYPLANARLLPGSDPPLARRCDGHLRRHAARVLHGLSPGRADRRRPLLHHPRNASPGRHPRAAPTRTTSTRTTSARDFAGNCRTSRPPSSPIPWPETASGAMGGRSSMRRSAAGSRSFPRSSSRRCSKSFGCPDRPSPAIGRPTLTRSAGTAGGGSPDAARIPFRPATGATAHRGSPW